MHSSERQAAQSSDRRKCESRGQPIERNAAFVALPVHVAYDRFCAFADDERRHSTTTSTTTWTSGWV